MRNFTLNWFKFFKPNFLVLLFLLLSYSASAQFYTKHYIAPAPWQYFSKANEIVIATNSTSIVNITLTKSDGTLVTTLTAIKGTPAVYRFNLLAKDLPMNALNTVISGAGLIVTSDGPTSVNMRNVASDDYTNGENVDANLKGNAALTSFGDAGIGVRFRIGYYRDGSLGNFSSLGDQRPIYSIMATANNTTVKINNAIAATLNAGQSYLFKAAIGTLVESSNPSVMNTSAAIDMPGGCGDGAFNQVPPESVLGTEYFIERGKGNDTAEQTTVVATKDNTVLTIDTYSTTGALVATNSVTLATAGSFHTFQNGVSNTSFSASRVSADKKVVVYSGTAQSCEVDISTIAPVSECGGSNFIETAKFRNYGTGTLPYFGYILLRSAADVVTVNGTNIETISGITARHQLGTTGWYLINFEDTQIGSPNVLSISSAAKLTVSIVQQGGGFSMAGFFSNFAAQPEDPTLTYISGGGCTNNKAELTTPAGFAPYQWYFNGTAIAGANSSIYTAVKTGSYSVASTLTCGAQTQSKPVSVTLCTDLGITKTVDNAAPCIGSAVEFTVTVSNLGGNNVSGVSVNDLLPSGYTYVSSTPSVGVYDSATGIWSIGDVEAQTSVTLKITATVNASGNYTNTASLPASIDTNTANNSASAAVTPKTSTLVVTNPAAICAPAAVDLTAPAVTAGSTSNMTLSYWTDANASIAYAAPSAVTASGTYYIKAVSTDGCQFIKPVVVTINPQPAAPTISVNSGSATCTTAGNTVLRSSSASGGSYLWSTGETTRNITINSEGSYSVKIINSSGCASNSSAVTVVTFTPAAPTASAQTFCSSENKKVSDLVASGTNLKWYSGANGGTALSSTLALATGNYYGSQTVNGCESSRTQVSVTINTTSSAPVASSQTFCASDNKKVSDLVAVGTNLKWYSAASGGTALLSTQTLSTGNYYVSQTANSCGESARTLVAVTIGTVPSAPSASSQTFCASDAKKVSDLVAVGTNLKWYSASSGGTLYTGTETLTSGNYYVSQTTNSCGESTRTLVAVTVNNTTAPTASSQTFCAIDAKKVSDLTASGTNLKWYSTSSGGTLYTGTETLTSGNYYVSQTLNSCESTRTLVAVTVNNTAVPTASSQTFCTSENKKVSDLVAAGTNLKWYNANTGGTLYSGTEVLASGNYYVSQTVSGCESVRILVSITVNPTPAAPTITADGSTTFCSGGTVTLTSTGGNSYLWSTGAVTQSITVSVSGTYSVRIANASGCQSASSTAAIVTVNPIPSAPTATAQNFCSVDAKNVSDLTATGTNLKWYSASTGGTLYTGTETLVTGTYYVSQTVTGCESARTSVSVTVNATPAVPLLSAVIQPTCLTASGSFTITNYDASNTYAINPSAGVSQSGDTVTAPAGSYTVTASANGCTSGASSAAVINAQPATPAVPLLSAVIQPTCLTASGSFTITNYDASNTYTISPSAGVSQSGDTVTAPAGSYTVTASANGCTSGASSAAVINAQPATPAVPSLSAVTQPTCLTASGSFTITNYDASNTYTVSPSAGVSQSGDTVTAPAGSYTVTASANGCTSGASSAAVINAQPATPAVPSLSAVIQPTCLTASGSFTITNYDASNTYTVSPSAGVSQSGDTVTAPAGSYTVTASANGCTSGASSAAVINAQPATPAVPLLSAVIQPACLTASGSFTITNYDASNTYTVSPSAGVSQSGDTVTAPAGSYTVTASANGCTSGASSAAVINAQPATPAVPSLSAVIQPACLTASGSFTITNYDASNTYTISPSAGVSQSGDTVTAPAGSYTVTASANGCTSGASSAAVINAQPATPAVPSLSAVIQPACLTASGSFTITNYDASNTYTISPSAGVSQSGDTVTAPAGSYTVTASANGCTSGASSAAVINAQPATPAVPLLSTVIQPTCLTASGSFTITNYDASNTYTISPSAGVSQSGDTVTAPAGSYTVTASANGCTSDASSAAVINAQPATPAVPSLSAVTQPACLTASGSFTITNYDASNTYTVSPSAGVSQSGDTVTAPAGSYTVTASANGCTSDASSAAVINAQPATPAVPLLSAVIQPTCLTASGSFTITNYDASNTYTVSPSAGVSQSGDTVTAPAGSYTVTASANGCTSGASSAAVINAQPATPAVPLLSAVIQPTCLTASGSFTITNYDASNTYTVSPSAGVSQSGDTVTAPAGSYTVTASANGCTSGASSAAVINAQPATPTVPSLSAVIQPTCLTASGSFTITNYDASNTYAINPSAGVSQSGDTVTAPAGSYTVTASANGCTSGASSAAVINAQPATPAVPLLSAVIQPTCLTASGSFTITNYDASNTYTISPSAGVSQSGDTVTAPAGSYTVTASANGCTSGASSAAVINAQPATPAVPSLSAVTQPTCLTASGSFTITNYDASNTYTVSPSAGVSQSGDTVTAPAGSYTVTASANGCTSGASSAAVINAQPATPAVPLLSAVIQPACLTASGSFTITNYDASNTYTVSPSAGVSQSGDTVTAPAGSYTVTASANGCTSGASSAAVINAQPATPAVPSLSAVIQPACLTASGSFTITNYDASNTYTVSPSAGVSQSGDTVTAPAGSYTVTASANGCTSGASSAAVINAQPATPAVPLLSAVIQPACLTASGSFTITNYDASNTYTVSPSAGVSQSGDTVTAPAGSYTVTASANGCTSGASSAAVINAQPATPAVPSLSAVIQPACLTASGSFTITNYDASNTYTVSPSAGVSQSGDTVTAPAGSYTVTASANGCTSGASSAAVINAQPATPAVPSLSAVIQPACLTASGSFTITNYDASNTYTISPSAGVSQSGDTVTAPAGSYTVTASANGCTSGASSAAVINAQPATPAVPSLSAVIQPACLTASGSFTITNYDASNTYTISPSAGVSQSGDTVTAPAGSYTVTASANGCTSGASSAAVINAQPATPAVPLLSTVIQPTCLTASGSFTITNYDASNTYTISPSAGVSQSGDTVTAPAGSYTVTASANGCTSGASSAAVINAQPATPTVPSLSAVTQPACLTASGSFTITNYDASNTYTVSPSAGVSQSGDTVTAPAGSYTVTASANGCTSGASPAAVISEYICAEDDTPLSVNGLVGGSISTIFANDKINGVSFLPADVVLTIGTLPTGITFNSNGTIDVAPNTAVGTHVIIYTICKSTNTSICDSATVTVIITVPVINAVTETAAAINGNTGGTTAALTANDTLNGNPVVIGTAQGNVTLTAVNVPSGLTLNADGTVTVAPSTAAGTYDVEYRICEVTNPSNCDAVISKVVVSAGTLAANPDTIGSVTAGNTAQTLPINVFDNDTKNGTALVPSDVNLTTATADPTGYLVLNPDGSLTLGANVPAGTYQLTYTICEKLNPSNCSSNTVSVTVGTPVIDAVTETTTSINGNTGGTTVSLTANDTLNGNPVVIGTAQGNVRLTAVNVPSGLTLNADGTVTVAPNTAAGTYDVEYSICEVTNPSNCDAVISKVVVSAGTLAANPDTIGSVTAGNTPQTLPLNVFDNDTKNGTALISSDVNLTTTIADPTGYLILNPDGSLTLGANAPAGTYQLTYTICEKLNPSNCSSNTVSVTVGTPVIDAVTETTTSINGNTGGTTVSLTANDTLNGNPVVIGTAQGNVRLTAVNVPLGLTLNADGTVTVAANTAAGTYDVEYRICEVTNPSNCDAVISKVVVSAGTLAANPDIIGSVTAGNTPQTLPLNVFDNDTKNGTALVPSDVNLTTTIADPTGYLVLNPDGSLTLGANAPAGTYQLTYTICEKLNPSNCSSNTVSVTVGTPVIDAVTETTASINGNTGGTTAALTANDTLNGNPVVIGTAQGNVTLTAVNVPSGLTLNADGTVTVAANTPAGTYDVEYSICEVTNPSNCDAVISKVGVISGVQLQAIDDIVGSVVGINQPQTIINVFDNDTNNGLPVVVNDINLSIVTPDPTGFLTLNPDGTVTLGANAPRGTYELTYQICEKLNPTNCSSASIKVTVDEPTMTVTASSYCSNNVPYVSYNIVADNFTPTNLLTIQWVDSANNVVATQTNLPLNGNILWPGAVIDGSGNGIDWPGWLNTNGQWIEGADGFEKTRPDVTMVFSLNPTASIHVNYPAATADCNARPTFTIKANNDTAGSIDISKGTSTGINVFDNDTQNGSAVIPANVTLSTVVPNTHLVLNADGTVDIKPGTQTGIYQLTYQICDVSSSSNCSQAVVSVEVLNTTIPVTPSTPITANNDGEIAVDGINGSLEFINVLDNDLLNGTAINSADVTISNTSGNTNFEFNADGTVNVKPNTPAGTYQIAYEICEKAAATRNCSSAVLSVFVEVPGIAIVKTAVFNDDNNNKIANAGETITYKFVVTNTGNVPLTGITITDPLPGVIVSGQAIDLAVGESNDTNFSALYKISQTDINNGTVTNQASVKGSSAKGVVVEDISDNSGIDGDKPTVITLNGCEINVINALSPNGDQKNERFYIQGLECYPDNTVEIYNRWGVLVFEKDAYNNEDRVFKGYSEGRTTMKQSEGLPVGTYFYILKYKDSGSNPHEKSGYLYINK